MRIIDMATRPVLRWPRPTRFTLDAGADKPLAFANLGAEENPALGRRGLRLSQVRTDLIDDDAPALTDWFGRSAVRDSSSLSSLPMPA